MAHRGAGKVVALGARMGVDPERFRDPQGLGLFDRAKQQRRRHVDVAVGDEVVGPRKPDASPAVGSGKLDAGSPGEDVRGREENIASMKIWRYIKGHPDLRVSIPNWKVFSRQQRKQAVAEYEGLRREREQASAVTGAARAGSSGDV